MTLFRCSLSGALPSGRSWSVRMHFSSGVAIGTVQTDWHTQALIAWNSGTNPLKIFYPPQTTLATTKTEQLAVVAFAGPPPVDKLRATAVQTGSPAVAGTNVNGAIPDQNAILVSLRNGLPGKENRGRMHLPAPSENLVSAGAMASADAAKVSARINGVLTGMIASGHNPVLVTYKVPHTGTPVGSTRPITVAETDEIIRTQRVRNKGMKAVYA